MARVLSLFLPSWDTELLDRRKDRSKRADASPLLLTGMANRQEVILRCCPIARAGGIHPGMTLAEARAIFPHARVMPFDAGRSKRSMERLALWAQRFSPTVAVDSPPPLSSAIPAPDVPDGLLLDVTGEAHLFGSEHLLLAAVAGALARQGFSTRLAIAPTVGAAWALARFARHPATLVDAEHVREAISPLPLESLRLPADMCARMRLVGLEQVADLLRLTRTSLYARFGQEVLRRLDQALAREAELITPLHEAEVPTVRRTFDDGTGGEVVTQLEGILLTLEELLHALASLLRSRESGARTLTVELRRLELPPVGCELVLGRPTRDGKHWFKLLRPKVEGLNLGNGVEALSIRATVTDRMTHEQLDWSGSEEADGEKAYEEFLDMLINRWGNDRVLAASPAASHIPELARRFRPARETRSHEEHEETRSKEMLLDRPTILLEQLEEAQALALQPDYPPVRLWWRGTEHEILTSSGPERIITGWWGTRPIPSSTRDYFKLQTAAGLWLWVFRELRTGRWFVHGLWS